MTHRAAFAAALFCALAGFGGGAHADDISVCEKETDPERAIPACSRVIEAAKTRKADFAWAFLNRGLSYRDAGELQRAVADISMAIELDPEDPSGPYHRALVYNDLAEYSRALEDLARAEQLDPKDPDIYNARNNVFIDSGRYAEALVEIDRALALDDDEKFYHNNRAVALTELGRCEDALASVEEALDIDDEYGNAIVNHGVALACLGRRDAAMMEFRRALDLYPKSASIPNAIAWKLSKSDRPGFRGDPFPLEMARRAVGLSDIHGYHDTLAAALANAGKFPDAAAEERKALEMALALNETGYQEQYSRRLAVYEKGEMLTE